MAEGSALEMVDQTVRFVHLKIQQSCGFISVQKSEYFAVLPCCSVLSIFQNFRLNIWRVVRVVEGAALEMLCSQKEPRVRIPNSPPKSPVTMRVCWTFLFFSKWFVSNIFCGTEQPNTDIFYLATASSSDFSISLHLL